MAGQFPSFLQVISHHSSSSLNLLVAIWLGAHLDRAGWRSAVVTGKRPVVFAPSQGLSKTREAVLGTSWGIHTC